MVKRTGTSRRKTRHTMRKHARERGKLSIKRFFQEFKTGDKVKLKAEPSYQKGLFSRRFQGKTGVVHSRQGNCYTLKIKDINREKTIIVHPIHMIKSEE